MLLARPGLDVNHAINAAGKHRASLSEHRGSVAWWRVVALWRVAWVVPCRDVVCAMCFADFSVYQRGPCACTSPSVLLPRHVHPCRAPRLTTCEQHPAHCPDILAASILQGTRR